jgi:hypothetical protein
VFAWYKGLDIYFPLFFHNVFVTNRASAPVCEAMSELRLDKGC